MTVGTKVQGNDARDFDFIHGAWRVRHRQLRERLAGSTEWLAFEGTMQAEPILGGLGNFDRNLIHAPGGSFEACTLRLFNPATGQWALHWVDARRCTLDPPLFGSFKGGIGTFWGEDRFDGSPIAVRFHWQQLALDKARWDQAFSTDGGRTWETNWIMEFTRQ